jgi:hypothetical protein
VVWAVAELVIPELLDEVDVASVVWLASVVDSVVSVEVRDVTAAVLLCKVFEVDFMITGVVVEARVVEVVFAEVVLAVVDDEVWNPSPPVTPTLSVGIVTDSAAETVDICAADVVFAAVVVVFANVGHRAPCIPPPCIIPSNELLVT